MIINFTKGSYIILSDSKKDLTPPATSFMLVPVYNDITYIESICVRMHICGVCMEVVHVR